MSETNTEKLLAIAPMAPESTNSQNHVLDQSISEFSSQPAKQNHNKRLLITAFLVLLLLGLGLTFYFLIQPKLEIDSTSSLDSDFSLTTSTLMLSLPKCADMEVDKYDSFLWKDEDSFVINTEPAKTLNLSFFNNTCSIDQTKAESQVVKIMDEVMINQGYTINNSNSNYSVIPAGWAYSDEIILRGYEKNDTKSLLSISKKDENNSETYPDEPDFQISFSMSDDYAVNRQNQIKLLDNLQLQNQRHEILKRVDNFVYVNVAELGYGGGFYIVAELQNDKWVKLIEGQDVPPCEIRDGLKIPPEIIDCHNDEPL